MAGEKFSGREPEGPYRDFPRLPGWNEVLSQGDLANQLALIMAALEPAAEQEPINPDRLDPVGLADWVGSAESRARSRICLTTSGEMIDFAADGRLSLRRNHHRDGWGRPTSLIEAVYNNPQSEPLATTKPVSIKAHGWRYDDRLAVAPLVGTSYSEYLRPMPGLVEQSVSTHWFIPSRFLPIDESGFTDARLGAAGEITAKYFDGQLTMLTAMTSGPDYGPQPGSNPRPIPTRRLRIELSAGEVYAAELIERLPEIAQLATIDIRRGPDGGLVQISHNPLAGFSRR